MHQARRVAVAVDADGPAIAGRAGLAGDGSGDAVGRMRRERAGRRNRQRARRAAADGRQCGAGIAQAPGVAGDARTHAAAADAAVPAGLAVVAGARAARANLGSTPAAGAGTLAGSSRTACVRFTPSEMPILCLYVKLY